jgi:hypothetical protein
VKGRKPELPSTKIQRATYRRDRGASFEITTPRDLPQIVDALITPRARDIWTDIIGPSASAGATSADSILLTLFANLLADLARCYEVHEAPPMSAIAEARKIADALGMAGPKSRIARGVRPGGEQPNPFGQFKR